MIERDGYLENLNLAAFRAPGPYHIPKMLPCRQIRVKQWIPFNRAASYSQKRRHETGVHFWLEDYIFKRVWDQPQRYSKLLAQYGAVMSPEFSVYEDAPGAIRIYNLYRNAWLGRYWQEMGINVVPCVLFTQDPDADYCWQGYPQRSILAISSVGCMDSSTWQKWFVDGYREMCDRLDPIQVLFYGKVPDECKSPLIVPIESYSQQLYRRLG